MPPVGHGEAPSGVFAFLKNLVKRYPNLAALLFGFLLVVLLLAAVEAVFSVMLKARSLPPWHFNVEYVETDPVLGRRAARDVEVRVLKQRPGQVAFEATYRTDSLGRRVTPLPDDRARPFFALFFGDSFTFGEGVEDNETLPAQFARVAPEFEPYNYGFGGYGPQQMFLQLQQRNLAHEVHQETGVVFYTYIDSHLLRLVGSMRITNTWGDWLPVLEQQDGEWRHAGFFGNHTSARQFFYSLAWRSNIVRFLQMDLPFIRQGELDLLADLLLASRAEIHAQLGEVPFIVVLYPESAQMPVLRTTLDNAGIQYIDLHEFFLQPEMAEHAYEDLWYVDGHPTPTSYRLVAADLARLLPEFGHGR